MSRPASDASGSAATIMWRLAMELAWDWAPEGVAARAGPKTHNDTASIADADAKRFMNPTSPCAGFKLTRRATLPQCGHEDASHGYRPQKRRVEIPASNP